MRRWRFQHICDFIYKWWRGGGPVKDRCGDEEAALRGDPDAFCALAVTGSRVDLKRARSDSLSGRRLSRDRGTIVFVRVR